MEHFIRKRKGGYENTSPLNDEKTHNRELYSAKRGVMSNWDGEIAEHHLDIMEIMNKCC